MIPPAPRTRTVLATSSHVELGVLDQRHVLASHLVDPEGCILMRPGAGACWDRLAAGEPCPQLDLVATDVTSVPQPDRIRATVRMRGRVGLVQAPPHRPLRQHLGLAAGQPMARFVPESIVLDLPGTAERRSTAVPLTDYAQAETDPLAGWEAAWISHLDAAHGATLRALARQHLPVLETDAVRALQADTRGLVVRVYRADSQRDLRFAFESPATCGCAAVAAFNAMTRGVLPSGG